MHWGLGKTSPDTFHTPAVAAVPVWWWKKKKPLIWSGTRMPDRDSYTNGTGSSNGGSGGGGSEETSGAGSGANAGSSDAICRDFLRNVCKRGKRCRYRHPDMSEVSNLGVSKNEFIFCHDFQNKECSRLNCRFIHGSKEDEDGYKKTGELPPRLRQKVAAGLGLSPADLPNGKEEVPICRDFLKGDCQRGAKCKFRHLQRDFEFEARGGGGTSGGGSAGPAPTSRRHDLYDTYDLSERSFEDHDPCPKRRRGGGGCPADSSHFETFEYSLAPPRGLECRLLEEENAMLRKRVEELKKQVSNLLATNEVLLEQNAQFRNQAKVMTLSSTAPATEQTLAPSVGTVTNYNHGIAQTHTTLSSQALQPRPVSQQELVAPTGAPAAPPTNAAPPTAPPPPPPPPHLNPEITPLSAALAQTIAQGMAPPPVSMAPVAVSVAPVAVSMAQPLAGITMSHTTTPMVTYPIASQSMRITAMPH
ncbi:LOW QUALITY PROTEIN: zinc finger CCCH domain-containing protein 10 [Petaurus breviceps papuanus]|uniref:LOW QUALITY PROTEIN: zinc finger CCCH domain-containing protein 10 n=1 Tax=Petaurus breviceps papuanus TaxID=3040969 RepID=UPI0036DB723E